MRTKHALVVVTMFGALLAVPGGGAHARPTPVPAGFAIPAAGERSAVLNELSGRIRQQERARRKKPRNTVKPLPEKVRKKIANRVAFRSPPVFGPKVVNVSRAAADPAPSALVLYDDAGPYGFLGELYAVTTANLAGHFGTVTAKPVQDYVAGEPEDHTSTIYIGSTYYGGAIPDAIPDAFYSDVSTTAKPVVWIGMNIWNLANKIGASAFSTKYGWDATNSFFGGVGTARVDYKGQPLTRTVPTAGDSGVIKPYVTNAPLMTRLATGQDPATTPATPYPWAVRSSNLTYLGEIPYAYVNETDRIIAWHDLLFDALAPGTATRHRAILRLEDISPNSDPGELQDIAEYLAQEDIPYAFQVVPRYEDPNGTYNNGVAETVRLQDRPALLTVLNYMLANGGRLIQHGYTHQNGSAANPYNGVTGDDFEFYRAHVDANDSVILDGPVVGDSVTWATNRINTGRQEYAPRGLPTPTIWTTPHYAASIADYTAIKNVFSAALERRIYPAGALSGGTLDYTRLIGQFFPYPVTDVTGGKVLPENLGNYEPEAYNNHPPRFPADIVKAAQYNLAVRDGFASFFYHPYFPVAPLQQTVQGIKGLGYTFVDPATVIP